MEVLVSTGVGSQGARKYEVIGEFDSSSTGCDITDLAPGRQKTIYIRVATPRAKGAIASITLQPPK